MTHDTKRGSLSTPSGSLAPDSIIEFNHSAGGHSAGERYVYTGRVVRSLARFEGVTPDGSPRAAFAPARLYYWLVEDIVTVVRRGAGNDRPPALVGASRADG